MRREHFDIVLLDEMMPGLDGLATVEEVKNQDPNVPVIMITKNEEEDLMDEAIGRRLDDYLTKPVNPSQIFMACRKILDSRQIRQSQAGPAYVSQANQIRQWLSGPQTWHTWIDIHRLLCEWDIEISGIGDPGLMRMIGDQRRECNQEFARFVEREYPDLGQERGGLAAAVGRCRLRERRTASSGRKAGLLHRHRLPAARSLADG